MLISRRQLHSHSSPPNKLKNDEFKTPEPKKVLFNSAQNAHSSWNDLNSSKFIYSDNFQNISPKTLKRKQGRLTAEEAIKLGGQRVKLRKVLLKETESKIKILEKSAAEAIELANAESEARMIAEANAKAIEIELQDLKSKLGITD